MKRTGYLSCSNDSLNKLFSTSYGKVTSEWKKEENFWRYEITTPDRYCDCY